MSNTIKIEMSKELRTVIKELSLSEAISMSSIIREVLKKFKKDNKFTLKREDDDYSQKIYLLEKFGVTKSEYNIAAKNITNEDINRIIKEIYD